MVMYDACKKLYGSSSQCLPLELKWMPPSFPCIKVNCDGSSLGNPGSAGFGVVLRSPLGDWIHGFSGFIAGVDNLCVELLALRKGLQLAWSLGFLDDNCEVDCLEVLRLINEQASVFHWYDPSVRDIKALYGRNWRCQVHHVYREANQVADFLVKLGAGMSANCDWEELPPSLLLLLHADQKRVVYLR